MPLQSLWAPPTPTEPRAATAPRSERVRRAAVATTAAGALTALIGPGRAPNSVAMALVVGVIAIAVVRAGVMNGRSRVVMVVAVLAFIPWLALRASPWLLIPDMIAASILAIVASSSRNGASLGDSGSGYLWRLRTAAIGASAAPRRAVMGVKAELEVERRHRIRQSIGPVLLGVAIAGAVALILASGDALFASYLEVGDLVSTTTSRFGVALAAMTAVVAGSGAAAASEDRPPIPTLSHGSQRNAIIVSTPLVVVYVGYVLVQCSTLLLGADHVRNRTGLTFAEYARSGFFQLVAVGLVTFVGLTMVRPIIRDGSGRGRSVLVGLAVTATCCTLAMVGAAVLKLDLYADVFGLTMLRVYTTVFAIWLGLALVIALTSLFRSSGEWMVPVVALTALAGVFTMNVVNPEQLVARHNLTETITSDEFDIEYLLNLSPDAVPEIVSHLEALGTADRERVIARICSVDSGPSGLDWNGAESRAAASRSLAC